MSFRDPTFNGQYDIPTFTEFLDLARNHSSVGIYPEIKDPELLNSLDILNGTRFEDIVLDLLKAFDYNDAEDLCYIQSFSEETIVYLSSRTLLPLVMLVENDVPDTKLDEWHALKVAGIGPSIQVLSKFYTPANGNKNWIRETTNFTERCHSRGFVVHPWTLRNEDRYLAWDFQQDVHKAFDHFLALNVDGLFTDFPKSLVDHLDDLYKTDGTTSKASTIEINTLFFIFVLVLALV